MKKLKKRPILLAGVAASLVSVGEAKADTEVVYANVTTNNMDTKNEKVTLPTVGEMPASNPTGQAVNNAVNNLVAGYKEVEKSTNGQLVTSLSQVEEIRVKLEELKRIKDQLQAQITNAANSKLAIRDAGTVTVRSLEELVEEIDALKDRINANNQVLNASTTVTYDRQLADLINKANATIKESAEAGTHYQDGIIKNMDDIQTASIESARVGTITSAAGGKTGVIVDIAQTERANLTLNSTNTITGEVSTATQVASERDRILAEISRINSTNDREATRARDYRDNSLTNIEKINVWLQEKQNSADEARQYLETNLTADEGVENYQRDLSAKLQALKTEVANTQTSADKSGLLASIEGSISSVGSSSLTLNQTSNINMLERVDFDDIGVTPSVIDAKIAQLNSAYDSALSAAKSRFDRSNAQANDAIANASNVANNSVDAFKNEFAQFLSKQEQYDSEKAQYDADKARIDDANRQVMESKGLTWTGDYAQDKAAVDRWNEENAGKSSSGTGLVVTPATTYTMVGGNASEIQPTPMMLRGIFTEGHPDKAFSVPPGGSVTIRVSNTSHGDVLLTFSNIHHGDDGWEGIKPGIVGIYDDGAGAIAYAVGTMASGEVASGCGEWGCNAGGGGYTAGELFGYIQSFDVHIVTDANDIQEFTYNDIDNGQEVTIHSGMGSATVRKGGQINQVGNTFVGSGGNVDQGRDGVLGSNSYGLSYSTPQKIDLTITHKYPAHLNEMYNIIAGIFGSSSEVKQKPIAIETVSAAPTPPSPPGLTVNPVNVTVETFAVSDPSAIAHTEGEYSLVKATGEISTEYIPETKRITESDIKFLVTTADRPHTPDTSDGEKQISAYNTSMVVRKLADEIARTGYGNTLVVRTTDKKALSASGNTFVVKTLDTIKKSASANTLAVRVIDKVGRASASGNTLTVRPFNPSVVKTNEKVTLSVYVEPSLQGVAGQALSDWVTALKTQGVELVISHKPLESVVGLAILDADSKTTRLDSTSSTVNVVDDAAFEMSHLAGLTVNVGSAGLVEVDSDDKLNKAGTLKAGQVLKDARMVIQLNTEAVTQLADQINVIKHELGYVFGLNHDETSTLMTTHLSDDTFTGVIPNKDIVSAAMYLRKL